MSTTVTQLPDLSIPEPLVYASFARRLAAYMLDGLIMMLVFLPFLMYLSKVEHLYLFAVLSVITYGYKPYCEYQFGATVGKGILRLQVVDKSFQSPVLRDVLLRNIFHIGFGALNLLSFLAAIASQFLSEGHFLQGALEWLTSLANAEFSILGGLIYLAEIACLLTDTQKRALHDRIAGTYVVKLQAAEERNEVLLDQQEIEKLKEKYEYWENSDLEDVVADSRYTEEAKVAAREVLKSRVVAK